MNKTQVKILKYINDVHFDQPLPVMLLSRKLKIPFDLVFKEFKYLINNGFVNGSCTMDDGSSVIIEITEKGRAAIAPWYKNWNNIGVVVAMIGVIIGIAEMLMKP